MMQCKPIPSNSDYITRLIEVRESKDSILPKLWELVADAEVVEKHEGLEGNHRWYRIMYYKEMSQEVDALVNQLY